MDSRALGLVIVAAGVVVILIGLAVATGVFGWFGRLPGDLRIEREGVRVYLPLASMLLVSVVLSLVIGLLRRFL